MILSIAKHGGARAVSNYVVREDAKPEWVAGSITNLNPDKIAGGIEMFTSGNTSGQLQHTVFHASLSLAPGEHLKTEEWARVTEDFTREMGFEDTAWVAVLHQDKPDQEHVHIVASRVDIQGQTVRDWNDWKRGEDLVRGYEKEYGLRQLQPRQEREMSPDFVPGARGPGPDEQRLMERREQEAGRAGLEPEPTELEQRRVWAREVAKEARQALEASKSMREFSQRMEAKGLEMRWNVRLDERGERTLVKGFSVVDARQDPTQDRQIKASQLGKDFGFKQLDERLKYDRGRDLEELVGARERAHEARDAREKNVSPEILQEKRQERELRASKALLERDAPKRERVVLERASTRRQEPARSLIHI